MFVELNPFLIYLCIRKGVLDEMAHRHVSLLFLKSDNEYYCSGEYSAFKLFSVPAEIQWARLGHIITGKGQKDRVMTMEGSFQ